ncbi:MAG: rhombosortase [Tolumonas sp.]|nr:rhombosortase [Tolumonas sp.]
MIVHTSCFRYIRHTLAQENTHFFLIAIVLLVILQIIQTYIIDLSFNRTEIAHHELWRLISGGLVHANFSHLLLNILGLYCLIVLYDNQISVHSWCITSLILVTIINCVLYLLLPSTEYYFGFSAALHGLFVWYSIIEWRKKHGWFPLIVLLVLIGKLGMDTMLTDSLSSQIIGMRVHWQSHWIGAVLGALLSFIYKRKAA